MSLDTYANLKTEIADHLDRDDLTSQIDSFIDLAESRHKRDVRIRQTMTRAAIVVNARYIDFPNDFLEMKTLRLLTSPITVLEELSIDQMNEYRRETTGKPQYYTVHNEIEFNVTPDGTYDGEIIYFSEVTPLSDANTSNVILERIPDLYLYGALLAAAPFLMNDERIEVWAGLYTEALKVNDVDRKKAGPLVSRVSGIIR